MKKILIGAYLNILIAILHILCLYKASYFFEITGVGENMRRNAEIYPLLPYVITLVVAIIFFVFGLYGLSAAGRFRKLPFLKVGVFSIAVIYLIRGIIGCIINIFKEEPFLWYHLIFSLFALVIGVFYLLGGWEIKRTINIKK